MGIKSECLFYVPLMYNVNLIKWKIRGGQRDWAFDHKEEIQAG